jgi:hypothetical protein
MSIHHHRSVRLLIILYHHQSNSIPLIENFPPIQKMTLRLSISVSIFYLNNFHGDIQVFLDVPLINNNHRFDSNQLIFSRHISTSSVTSIEFVLTSNCSTNEVRQSLSDDDDNMINAIEW